MAEWRSRGHPNRRERNRGTVFSRRSLPTCYKQDKSRVELGTCVEAGSNIFTVALRVVEDGEKGIQCLRV
jgi:hypothetical protein